MIISITYRLISNLSYLPLLNYKFLENKDYVFHITVSVIVYNMASYIFQTQQLEGWIDGWKEKGREGGEKI